MDWKVFLDQGAAADPRFGRLTQQWARPAWPVKLGLMAGVAVVILPLIVVVLAGLLVGGTVYAVGSMIQRITDGVAGGGPGRSQPTAEPGDDVRENVRVIRR